MRLCVSVIRTFMYSSSAFTLAHITLQLVRGHVIVIILIVATSVLVARRLTESVQYGAWKRVFALGE